MAVDFLRLSAGGITACAAGNRVNRLRWVWAQIELPGEGKRASLAMLLKPDEVPGTGWKKLDQRAWRTGFFPNPSEAALRARDVESVSAIRSFEQADSRWVWIEVIPLVSAPDAELMWPRCSCPSRGRRSP